MVSHPLCANFSSFQVSSLDYAYLNIRGSRVMQIAVLAVTVRHHRSSTLPVSIYTTVDPHAETHGSRSVDDPAAEFLELLNNS